MCRVCFFIVNPCGLFCLTDSVWLYDCLFVSFTEDWLWTYSHNTENTFIDTKNIHYDTVKRYNNYTGKEITELKQHHYVFVYLFVCPRSSSSLVLSQMCWARRVLWTPMGGAPGWESRVPPALLLLDGPVHGRGSPLLKEPPKSFAVVDRRPLWETKCEGHI